MNRKLIVRMLGALLLIESAAMIPSLIISLIYGDGDASAITYSILINSVVGLLMVLFTSNIVAEFTVFSTYCLR